MKTTLKQIKRRLLIILTISLLLLTFTLHWVFVIPTIISLMLAHEANEFDFTDLKF